MDDLLRPLTGSRIGVNEDDGRRVLLLALRAQAAGDLAPDQFECFLTEEQARTLVRELLDAATRM